MKSRKIYYGLIVVLALIMFVLSFLSVHIGGGSHNLNMDNIHAHINRLNTLSSSPSNSRDPLARRESMREYIVQQLQGFGIAEADVPPNHNNHHNVVLGSEPTFVLQTATVSAETSRIASGDTSTTVVWAGTQINNIIVVFPGTNTRTGQRADAVVFDVLYDSYINLHGAMTFNADIAIMLDAIRQLNQDEPQHSNDIVFVFGEGLGANLGLHTFANQFYGFDNINNRTQLAVGMRGVGSNGSVAIFDSSSNNYRIVSSMRLFGTNSSSLAEAFWRQSPNVNVATDMRFGHVLFGNFGDLGLTTSPNDSVITQHTLDDKASLTSALISGLQSANISNMSSNFDAVYFNYLGLVVVLPSLVYIIAGIVALILLVGVMAYAAKRKVFDFRSVFRGAIVQLLSLGVAILFVLGAYYLFGFFLLVAFGVVPMGALNSFSYYNIGILIAFALFALAAANIAYKPLKQLLKAKSIDVVRGGVAVLTVFGAILTFVAPALSYPFIILALLQLVVMWITVRFKDKFKAKYGYGIERMFLYGIPVLLTIPLAMPSIIAAAQVLPMMMYSLIAGVFVMLFGFVLPYLSFVKPKLDKAVGKLPKYNLRRVVVEQVQVEDVAKKGKFSTETQRRVEKVPTAWEYKNYIGTIVFTVIAAVVFFVSSLSATGFGVRVDSNAHHMIFNNAVVLTWEQGSGGQGLMWEIRDRSLFGYADRIVEGFEFSSARNALVRPQDVNPFVNTPTITNQGGSTTRFTPADPIAGQIELVATGASNVSYFDITLRGESTVYFEINNRGNDTVRINLPLEFGNLASGQFFEITTRDNQGQAGGNVSWQYTEYVFDHAALVNQEVWISMYSYFAQSHMAHASLRGGAVFRLNTN